MRRWSPPETNSSAITGADAGKDTEFLVYGQTTSGNHGVFAPAKIQRLDGDKVAFTLDGALPAWSMYLHLAAQQQGYGSPIAVNRTEAWWVGPNKAIRGQTISVFGRNLSHDNGTTHPGSTSRKNATTVEPAR